MISPNRVSGINSSPSYIPIVINHTPGRVGCPVNWADYATARDCTQAGFIGAPASEGERESVLAILPEPTRLFELMGETQQPGFIEMPREDLHTYRQT